LVIIVIGHYCPNAQKQKGNLIQLFTQSLLSQIVRNWMYTLNVLLRITVFPQLISGEKILPDNTVMDNPLVQDITDSMNPQIIESIVVMFVLKANAVGL
jgi:hypothetical protein